MSKYISPNSREAIGAYDPMLEQFFYIEGTAATGAINVNVVGGGGGGTQYTEGNTTSPAVGTAFLGRYESAPSGISTDNGLYAPLMDNFHQLKVVPVGTVTVSGTVAVSSIAAGSNNIGSVNVANITGTANFATNQVALATSATQIVNTRATRRSITIVNLSTTDMYIGGASVTTSNGQLLLGTKGTAITLEVTGAIYGIVASGTPSVSYEEEYA